MHEGAYSEIHRIRETLDTVFFLFFVQLYKLYFDDSGGHTQTHAHTRTHTKCFTLISRSAVAGIIRDAYYPTVNCLLRPPRHL